MVTKSTIWRRANPIKAAATDRRARLKRYGLTTESFARLLKDQNHLCVICLQAKELVVDHNHDTGEVRGLLCRTCNRGIGLLQDDAEIIQRAADYTGMRTKV